MFIKICGITNTADARFAVSCGATALGFIFYDRSPRYITPDQVRKIIEALPQEIDKVGVFVNSPIQEVNQIAAGSGLTQVQLHGDEDPAYCRAMKLDVIKAFRIKNSQDIEGIRLFKTAFFLLDAFAEGAYGGTGKTFDRALALKAKKYGTPLILSGGLTPDNVADSVRKVTPYGVDVSSGVELEPGLKDHEKVKRFIENAIEAFAEIAARSSDKGVPDV